MSQVPDQVKTDVISILQIAEDQEERLCASQVGEQLDDRGDEIEVIGTQIGRRSQE